jgi:hypothetical protein
MNADYLEESWADFPHDALAAIAVEELEQPFRAGFLPRFSP